MKNWISKNYKTLIISAFLFPIITVAIVSISHVTMWYGLSNPVSWAMYLSLGIEIAALSALAAISANMGSKVYFPFIVVTIIQFIGNIFFAYSFIDVSSKGFVDWVELVSPLLEFIGVESTNLVAHKRVLSLFSGGMLPVISLSFLHMLVKFTEESNIVAPIVPDVIDEEPKDVSVKKFFVDTTKEPTIEEQKEFLEKMKEPIVLKTETIIEGVEDVVRQVVDTIPEESVMNDIPPVKLTDEDFAKLDKFFEQFEPKYDFEDEEIDEDASYDEDGIKVDLEEVYDDDYQTELMIRTLKSEPPLSDDFKDTEDLIEDEVTIDEVKEENISEDTEKKN